MEPFDEFARAVASGEPEKFSNPETNPTNNLKCEKCGVAVAVKYINTAVDWSPEGANHNYKWFCESCYKEIKELEEDKKKSKEEEFEEFDDPLVNLESVILDECHYMNDPQRGTVWEETIIHCPSRAQIIALSATISNADQLQNWIEKVHGPTVLVNSNKRPVPLDFIFS